MDDRAYLSLQELQQEELRLLAALDEICRAHGLTYYLDGGTLIGAVRHHGFIPWDDDIDVSMPRPSCDKLLTLKDEFARYDCTLGGFYGVEPEHASQMRVFSNRVRIESTTARPHGDDYLWVDIFPVDGNPDDEATGRKECLKASLYRKLMAAGFLKWKTIGNPVIAAGCFVLGPFLRSMAFRRFCSLKINRLQYKYPYGSTGVVGSYCNVSHGEDRMPLAEYEQAEYLEFEGGTYPVMACWDMHLRKWYGDYLQLPPESERIPAHRFDTWWVNGRPEADKTAEADA